jgi:ferredoxin
MIEFETRTGKIIIDDEKCIKCNTFACVQACSLYNGALYRINFKQHKPALAQNLEDMKRRCTECLACEQECQLKGLSAIKIILPMPELESFKKKRGLI